VTKTYTYGLQRISENQLSGSTWTPTFYGYDGHGNVRFTTNTAGTVGNTYQFDAFGMNIASTGTIANTYLYSGERFDSNLNLYELRARFYNMLTGRFETMDPWHFKPSCKSKSPSSTNAYAFVSDDPVNRFDPTGRAEAVAELAIDLRGVLLIALGGIRIYEHSLSKNLTCSEQLDKCIDQCTDELRNGEWPFRKCVADCMADAGCDYTIPRPWY